MNLVNLWDTKSIYKNLLYFYAWIKTGRNKIMKTIPFTIASKRIKYTGMHLIKKVKHLCTKNYMTLMKVTEEDTSKWIFCAHKLEEFTLLKS